MLHNAPEKITSSILQLVVNMTATRVVTHIKLSTFFPTQRILNTNILLIKFKKNTLMTSKIDSVLGTVSLAVL